MKTLLLIDANSIIHRSFHALPPLTTPDGRPIQAIYGISSILLRLWREDKPDYAAALFDRPEPTFRKKKFAEYKAQRPAAPDELISQIIEAHNIFLKFGVKTFELAGWEADDLIATFAEKFKKTPDLKIVILTGDRDTLQLVENDVVVVRTFKTGISDTFTYNRAAVLEKYGLEPEQMVDYKALVGDPSDNIKGVPGVGPKTASELLKNFGTLENIYNNLAGDQKLEKRLGAFRKEAELAKDLVTLDRNAPIGTGDIKSLEVIEKSPAIKKYFEELGFGTLIKRLEGAREEKVGIPRARAQATIFSSPKVEAGDASKNTADVIFIKDPGVYSADYASKKLKVGFDLKPLLKSLRKRGKDLKPPYFDLGVAFWLLDPDLKNYEPPQVFRKFLKREWTRGDEDLEVAYNFSRKKLEEYKLKPVFENIEMLLLGILAEMEHQGIGVSSEKLKVLEAKISGKLSDLAKEIYEKAGEVFNINSPKRVSEILFDKLNIGGELAKTKTGMRTTRAANLEELRGRHAVVGPILDYRESFKILSTYVRPLLGLADKDGRLHTEFVQTGASTGRLSSRSPNLQNIPQESVWAPELRSAFESAKGFSFLALDYSQIELRILAALSGDKNMLAAFRDGQDIHKITAAKVLGLPPEEIGANERRLAKAINFGFIYGMGLATFAKVSGLSKDKAKKFMDAYFREFRGIKEWQEKTENEARTFGYVQTLTGRRRYFFGIASESQVIRARAGRAAINHPVQGLGADIIKMAMIKIRDVFEESNWQSTDARMILSIHDELLFEVRDDMIEKIAGKVKGIMENVYPLDVPILVEISAGKNWGHLKKFPISNF